MKPAAAAFARPLVAVALACLLAPGAAHAYAPSALTLVKRMAWSQGQDNPRRLVVQAGALTVDLRYPGRCTLRRGDEVAQRSELGVTTNSNAADLRTLVQFACELLALRGANAEEAEAIFTRFLEKNAIDPMVVSLGRLAGRVAYVIGAAPGQTDRPQLWIDRDQYVPLRLIARDPDRDGLVDAQFTRYMPAGVGYAFPRLTRIVRGAEEVVLRAEAFVTDPPEEAAPAPATPAPASTP